MRIIKKSLTAYAVYWAPAGTDDHGQPTYADPVELRVRWEETSEIFKNKDGEDQVSKSKVAVSEDVEENGVLWQGRLADVPADNLHSPFANDEALVVARFMKMPTLNGKQFYRVAFL